MCARSEAQGQEIAAIVRKVKPSVVTILADNPDRAMPGIGTGFLMAPDRVLTARHVLAGAEHAEVRTVGGDTIGVAGLIAEDRSRDLAILALEGPAPLAEPVPVAQAAPEEGETVIAIGSPLGLEWSVSTGTVASLRDIPGAGTILQHTAPVSPGSSGGPLFNLRGEAVGVQISTLTTGTKLQMAGENLNFAVPAAAVAGLSLGPVRSLVECAKEVPAGWHVPIDASLDACSLRFLERSDFVHALPFYEEAAKRRPDDAYVWLRVALCRSHVGNAAGAIEAYRQVVKLKPDMAVAQNNLGVAYLQRGETEAAAQALRKAVEVRPTYCEAWANLGDAYLRLGKNTESLEAYRQSVKANGGYAVGQYGLGLAYLKLNQREKAQEACDLLRKLDGAAADRLTTLLATPPAIGG